MKFQVVFLWLEGGGEDGMFFGEGEKSGICFREQGSSLIFRSFDSSSIQAGFGGSFDLKGKKIRRSLQEDCSVGSFGFIQ
jgi:hypothetical protein